MFKNMKLAAKIGLGFATLVIIAVLLGLLAIINMSRVNKQSTMLSQEYIPEVAVNNEVERYSLLTMYSIRGYGFTEEERFLKDGQASLENVKASLASARDLAAKSVHLVKLAGAVDAADKKVQEYGQLLEQTVALNKKLEEDRHELDKNAAAYMGACEGFLKGQNEALKKEVSEGASADKLLQRHEKITLVNEIIDLGNAARLAVWRSQAQRDPAIIRDAMPGFDMMNKKFDALKPITHLEADLKEIETTRAAAESYKKAMNSLLANWLSREEVAQKRGQTADEVLGLAQETAKAGLDQAVKIGQSATETLSASSAIMIIGLLAAVVVSICMAIFITLSITKPIQRVIDGLASGAEQVTSASGQVSSASQSLAQGASEQASSLEETSSSLEEMSSMTRQNADNANQANVAAKEASQMAETGVAAMQRMSEAIEKIKNSSNETAKIIKTIDEIAFQTNLLALNAAVEAARAGEAGKGFAVVAEEVRNLARRSAEAAKNTADLIEGAQKNSEQGVAVTAEVAKSLTGIQSVAGKVATLIAEIAAASKEQAQGIDQVNTAVSEMDKVVQQNAANSEESASASEELSSQAEELMAMVEELMGIVGGKNGEKLQTGTRKAISARKEPAAANRVHTAVHHAPAKAPARKLAAAPAKPEEVIPLDDKEFKDF